MKSDLVGGCCQQKQHLLQKRHQTKGIFERKSKENRKQIESLSLHFVMPRAALRYHSIVVDLFDIPVKVRRIDSLGISGASSIRNESRRALARAKQFIDRLDFLEELEQDAKISNNLVSQFLEFYSRCAHYFVVFWICFDHIVCRENVRELAPR